MMLTPRNCAGIEQNMQLTTKTVFIAIGLLGLIAAVLIFGFVTANTIAHDQDVMRNRPWEHYACIGFAIAMAAVILIFGATLLKTRRRKFVTRGRGMDETTNGTKQGGGHEE
jgi:hypothetical protein